MSPKLKLDKGTSNKFATAQGDSEKSSQGTCSSTCSVIDRAATRLPASDSLHPAPRNRRQVERDIRRKYRNKSHEALRQQEHLDQEQSAQQQWEAEQRLRVEATKKAAYTLTQLNTESRVIEFDTSEKDGFYQIQIQASAICAVEATGVQKCKSF